ncbi:electron transport complex subunit RsxC [Vibrio sp. SS-MA-C1-2]|uniref:electron transport complex subunit RsxC n=1 Tax=Vibrio sp. SS-MA-C1-2 TaxID=2908646 RepID=UPI001F2F1F33|nr:electron transport complex subunit RsxC [Vibrio sp. SS-MA-C1-2]UJF18708.1 electron transport complex subunit RsxC [Vibrio sp. SS-MA-C1-2]
MLSLIAKIKQGQLWSFPGGIHPPEVKELSNKTAISRAEIPKQLIIPIKQHIGIIGDTLVKVGDRVLKGQPLTQPDLSMCVPIHASTSGTVIAIEPRTVAHPSGLSELCIVIESDGEDLWYEKKPLENYQELDPVTLINHIRASGITGLGGAGFPTARKLQGSIAKTDILIINAAECEPYITADDRLMREYADEIMTGINILRSLLSPKLVIIGIEDNKPEAVKALNHAAMGHDENLVIRVIPTKYPSGGEKQLIQILTGQEVPKGKIPADIGMLVQNVGTLFAIKRAVFDGEPLIERVVTLTGRTFKKPGNSWVRIGTLIDDLIQTHDYVADKKAPRIIMGGPMMGFTLPHFHVPVTKTANCLLAPNRKEIPVHKHEMACIRCSACAEACPVSLLPQQLQWYAKDQDYDKCEQYNLSDCIECGACAYVCPSEIPLVHYYRQAKAEIKEIKLEAQKAERAKQRFEARNARLEREKEERNARFKKPARNQAPEKSAAISDAINRVKAAKSEQAPTGQKPAVAAAIARAKAKQAAAIASANGSVNGQEVTPDNSEMIKLREERKAAARARKAEKSQTQSTESQQVTNDAVKADPKKDAVAAAIARAKARKAAQQAAETPVTDNATVAESSADKEPNVDGVNADPKKAAVAAAIARAKARKAAQQAAETPVTDNATVAEGSADKEPNVDGVNADPKKAAVAAAIARAKARKAAQQAAETPVTDNATVAESSTDKEPNVDGVNADPKKAAVAAAIARAKARKAAQQAAKQATENDQQSLSQPDNKE